MNNPVPSNDPLQSASKSEVATRLATDTKIDEAESKEPPKICLDQFLKTCGVETGGQAKRLIQGGEVLVNNELETRRRRKLVPGDEVQLYEDVFVVALAESIDSEPVESDPIAATESD